MPDKLNMAAINALQRPLIASLYSLGEYEIDSIDVQTGLCRINVSGMLDVVMYSEFKTIIDGDMTEHDPDKFYIEE